MALRVKAAADSAAKFVARAQAAGGDYTKGVSAAGDLWQQKASAAGDAYAAGVQAAIGRKGFEKGVAKAGAQKYVANASTKGASRYPAGVAQAGPNWQSSTQPYLDTLAGLNLPPRHPRGDPGNIARVQAVADALRKKKLGS